MKIETLGDLFSDLLFDMEDAEQRLVSAMPEKIDAAYNSRLRDALQNHFFETERHVERLQKVISMLEVKKSKKDCEVMQELIKETGEFIQRIKKGPVLDAALIAVAQKIEHYEIAAYGALCSLAKILNHSEAAEILHKTLEEEKGADKNLSSLALDFVNEDALRVKKAA